MDNYSKIYGLFICCLVFFISGCSETGKKKTDMSSVLDKAPFAVYTDSIRKFPDDIHLYFERAQLLSKNNLHEIATADYKKSWESAPGELTAIQYASNLSIINKPNEELQLLQSGLQQFPASRELKRILGEAYIQSKNKEALQLYDKMLQNDSADFEAWFEKGMLFAKIKDTVKAIDALKNAYAIQPISTYALELAHLYAETNNAAALGLCDNVISKDSARDMIDPFFIKGIYYANTRQYEKGIAQFDSCIRRDWKFTEAYIEKGIAFFEQKNYDVAINTFRMAATVSNTYPDAYYWIGRCYEAINKKEEAEQYYERAIALDKNFTEAKDAIKRLKSTK
jgi:tetratricopeptide (TPR) repeat protein